MGQGIYSIKLNNTDKIYIGKTSNFKNRWNQHIALLNNNKHHCADLQNHFNSLNENKSIKFSVLEFCEPTHTKEKQHMKKIGSNKLFNTKKYGVKKTPIVDHDKNSQIINDVLAAYDFNFLSLVMNNLS